MQCLYFTLATAGHQSRAAAARVNEPKTIFYFTESCTALYTLSTQYLHSIYTPRNIALSSMVTNPSLLYKTISN